MNEADINQRMNELVQMESGLSNEIQNINKVLTQKQADLFAVQGAKQDCAFWLSKVSTPETKVPVPVAPPTIPPAVLKEVAKTNAPKPAAKPVQKKVTNNK